MKPNPSLRKAASSAPRHCALAFAMTLLLSAPAVLGGDIEGLSGKSAGEGVQRFIVQLDSPPVPLFEGFGPGASPEKRALRPTRPASVGQDRLTLDTPEVLDYRRFLAAEQANFEAMVTAELGRTLKPVGRFDLALNGLVLELDASEAERIAGLPGVRQIEPDYVQTLQTDAGPSWVRAPAVWTGVGGAGTLGAGVVVGIIDSGLNAGHPSFAGVGPVDGHAHTSPRASLVTLCATPNTAPCNGKLIGLRDFTTGNSSREPDNGLDPDGHGSHVAATAVGNRLRVSLDVGGQSFEREVSGVAPHANLISYKACEVEAKCVGSWTLAAINAAIGDGVDVINYSIGGDPRDPWTDSSANAMLAAREAGIVVAVAAGNSGPRQGSVTSPGNAPWVIGVANASHDRSIGNRLVEFSGGAATPPGGGSLLGAGNTGAFGPARIVIPQDFPGCGTTANLGLDANGNPDGSTNPWAGNPNRFSGEIVVCERGTHARLAKGDNVRRAGGGGMILVNTVGDGESLFADSHVLPATHIGFRDAELLREWLGAGGQFARIEGSQLLQDPSLADRLSASSGRGPILYGGVMQPAIAAPGTSVLAAAGTGNGLRTLSGTSMASPHVAGAAALLRARHPGWRADQIQAALMSTGRDGLRREDAVSPARRIDVGAGGLDVAAAVRSGLYMETSRSAFVAARPSSGGQPRELNLPGLLHERCFERCALSRTVRSMVGAGRWRARVELPGASASVQPAEFDLDAVGSRRLDLDLDLRGTPRLGGWVEGALVLEPVQGPSGLAVQRFPLAVFADPGSLPQALVYEVDNDAGFVDIPLAGLAELVDLRASAGPLSVPVEEQRTLPRDPSPDRPYQDIGQGSFFVTVTVPAATRGTPRRFLLIAEADSPSARDVDLFVGIDYNSNGRPDEAEALCRGITPDASERCQLEVAQSGSDQQVWVLVQNHLAGSAGQDVLNLRVRLLDTGEVDGLAVRATSPAKIARTEPFSVRYAFDDPGLLPGERRVGLLSLRAAPGSEPFARIPVELRRGAGQAQARALMPGRPQSLRLAGGASHERVFVDVAPGSSALEASLRGPAGTRIEAVRLQPGSDPRVPAAPASVVASATAGADGRAELRIEGAALQPGRWYLRPVNPAGGAVSVEMEARLQRAGPAPVPRFGAWFNPDRSGAGLFLFRFGGSWGLLWYNYLEDGTPTWYTGAAPAPAANASVWAVPLLRHVWDGRASDPREVGEALLSFEAPLALQFSFRMDGRGGSEPMVWIGGERCPQGAGGPLDVNGLWFDAENPGFGYSVDAQPNLETVGQFFYDARGVARWTFGSVQPFAAGSIPMLQFSGACPLCSYAPPPSQPIGSLQASYTATGTGSLSTELEFRSPLAGRWQRSHALTRLSDAVGCPAP